jgi:hypothetical protein
MVFTVRTLCISKDLLIIAVNRFAVALYIGLFQVIRAANLMFSCQVKAIGFKGHP